MWLSEIKPVLRSADFESLESKINAHPLNLTELTNTKPKPLLNSRQLFR